MRALSSGTPGSTSPAPAPSNGDLYVLQDESNTTDLGQYEPLYTTAAVQARAANSAVKVYSEVSTSNGTADQMTAAAKSISPDGFTSPHRAPPPRPTSSSAT